MTPRSYVATQGSSVTFKCSSESEPIWTKSHPHGIAIREPVYFHDGDFNIFSMTIINVKYMDTGRYICNGRYNDTDFSIYSTLYVGGKTSIEFEQMTLLVLIFLRFIF